MADPQLQPGTTVTRAEIRKLFGGSPQGGIAPSITSKTVLLYSDPAVGRRYGYHDGWLADEDEHGPIFEYTGAGAVGDQTFTGTAGSGNRAILRHVEAERSLRVFVATGKAPGSEAKLHRYVGEFRIDSQQPFVLRQMPDTSGNLREVIVFRLRPAGAVDRDIATQTPEQTLASLHSDSSTTDDLLGNAAEVDKMAKLVSATTTEPPLAIAVLGKWGAGKSSFMDQMNLRIKEIANLSKQAKANESAFVSNIDQIRFNAWHYGDEYVWPGLIEKLFRTLSDTPEDQDYLPGNTEKELAQLKAELKELKNRKELLEKDLATVAGVPHKGIAGRLSTLREGQVLIRAAIREIRAGVTAKSLLKIAFLLLSIIFLVTAAFWAKNFIQLSIANTTASLIAIYSAAKYRQPVKVFFAQIRKIFSSLRGYLEYSQNQIAKKSSKVNAKLAEISAAFKLLTFLEERNSSDSYQGFQGLLAQVHADLTKLDEALRESRKEWVESEYSGQPPLQRIVLYIDDLDRCSPARVVEVLAAVNLMLALPLFVVVVAVDPRWLISCLEHHYGRFFTDTKESRTVDFDDTTTPIGYLDKIFQIPFAVPPTTPEKIKLLLDSLLGVPDLVTSPADSKSEPSSKVAEPSTEETTGTSTPQDKPASSTSPSVEPALAELNPDQMKLTTEENVFMSQLGDLLPTPRAAKKLVNLYRLVRMGAESEGRSVFSNTSSERPGEYQAVQFLLALLVGHPDQARMLFQSILKANPSEIITDVLRNAGSPAVIGLRAADMLDKIKADTGVRLDVRTYQHWCPILARYSFYTRRLTS